MAPVRTPWLHQCFFRFLGIRLHIVLRRLRRSECYPVIHSDHGLDWHSAVFTAGVGRNRILTSFVLLPKMAWSVERGASGQGHIKGQHPAPTPVSRKHGCESRQRVASIVRIDSDWRVCLVWCAKGRCLCAFFPLSGVMGGALFHEGFEEKPRSSQCTATYGVQRTCRL